LFLLLFLTIADEGGGVRSSAGADRAGKISILIYRSHDVLRVEAVAIDVRVVFTFSDVRLCIHSARLIKAMFFGGHVRPGDVFGGVAVFTAV
jgi:hypothetical protein